MYVYDDVYVYMIANVGVHGNADVNVYAYMDMYGDGDVYVVRMYMCMHMCMWMCMWM